MSSFPLKRKNGRQAQILSDSRAKGSKIRDPIARKPSTSSRDPCALLVDNGGEAT